MNEYMVNLISKQKLISPPLLLEEEDVQEFLEQHRTWVHLTMIRRINVENV